MKVEERVINLEEILASYLRESDRIRRESNEKFERFVEEMAEFKDEMAEFKNEMKDFKEEMKDFKKEMQDFKEESRQDRKKLFREWGHLSNKLGSVAEDIAAPGVIGLLRKHFGVEVNRLMHTGYQRNVKDPSRKKEIDVIAVTDDYFVLCEIKTTIREQYIHDFVKLKDGEIYDYFPEYLDKKLIPVFSSFDMDDTLIRRLSKHNVLSLVMGEDHMVVANPELVERFKV